jgi:hypothetical protein
MGRLIWLKALFVNLVWASEAADKPTGHQHQHLHEVFVDGERLQLDSNRFDRFVKGLSNCQIAVVSVMGMVCDFCARGIEKSFKRDPEVIGLDVDLSNGKIFIAFSPEAHIDFDEIKERILVNGQNATSMHVLELD